MKELIIFIGLLIAYIAGAVALKQGGQVLDSSQDDYLEEGQYTVTDVVDGDTIVVTNDEGEYKVRLIGVDTPETVDPRKEVQCFGQEASSYTKRLLLDQPVYLKKDETQTDVDKYDRWLRYVILPDGTNYNQQLIAEGYAFEYTYDQPYLYQDEFKLAQKEARETQRGLWSPDSCNGET